MLQEAKEGRFATKGDAVKRRDQLVGEAAPQAVPADESQAAPAEESAPEACGLPFAEKSDSQSALDVN